MIFLKLPNTTIMNKLDWATQGTVGDIMFMNGHVGIFGKDDQDNNIMIHSAPAITLGGQSYNSGPRIQEFSDLLNGADLGNDSYMRWLINANYFSGFRENFTYGFGSPLP
jgi:hypothetical protein